MVENEAGGLGPALLRNRRPLSSRRSLWLFYALLATQRCGVSNQQWKPRAKRTRTSCFGDRQRLRPVIGIVRLAKFPDALVVHASIESTRLPPLTGFQLEHVAQSFGRKESCHTASAYDSGRTRKPVPLELAATFLCFINVVAVSAALHAVVAFNDVTIPFLACHLSVKLSGRT